MGSWLAGGEPASLRAVSRSWWRCYRGINGPLQSLLLTLFVFLAIVPAVLVVAEYLERNPAALANHFVGRYHLTGSGAGMLRDVLVGDRRHELGSALFAVATVLVFGLGFGRVLQLVHTRAWGFDVEEQMSDQIRYSAVLLVLFALIVLLLGQVAAIAGHPPWADVALAPAWVAVLCAYFVWAPWYLLRGKLPPHVFVLSGALSAVGLVGLMFLSSIAMAWWIDLYARDFSGFGVFMALFFWLALSSTLIVMAACLPPALAQAGRARSVAGERARIP